MKPVTLRVFVPAGPSPIPAELAEMSDSSTLNNAEYTTFIPADQSLLVGMEMTWHDDTWELSVGSPVTFWICPGDKRLVYIYDKGSLGGSHRIGTVPDYGHAALIRHIREGLLVDASVARVQHGICWIRYRLIPREELIARLQEDVEKSRSQLLIPYHPRNPILLTVQSILSCDHRLQTGDLLQFGKVPVLDDIVEPVEVRLEFLREKARPKNVYWNAQQPAVLPFPELKPGEFGTYKTGYKWTYNSNRIPNTSSFEKPVLTFTSHQSSCEFASVTRNATAEKWVFRLQERKKDCRICVVQVCENAVTPDSPKYVIQISPRAPSS